MDCLAKIKFLDALDQPIQGLAHQFWLGNTLISDNITAADGESVWIKRPIGTRIDIKVKSSTTGSYQSKVSITLLGTKTLFIVRSPKVLLKGLNLSAKDVATGDYLRSTYIVASGDYLSRIAEDQKTTTAELVRINQLRNDTDIYPGQVLKIPPQPTQNTQSSPSIQQKASQNKTTTPVVKVATAIPINASALLPQACGGEKHYQRTLSKIAELHPVYQPYIVKLINSGYQQLGICWAITDGYRSPSAQDALPSANTKAKGLSSYHQYGLAIDLSSVRDGELVAYNTKLSKSVREKQVDQDRRKLGPIGEGLGLVWGGRWKSIYDPGHFELHPNGKTWQVLKPVLQKIGVSNYKSLTF